MIHLHIFIQEHKKSSIIEAEASREISKTETKAEIDFANKLLAFLKGGLTHGLDLPDPQEDDWWKNEDGEPPFRRN